MNEKMTIKAERKSDGNINYIISCDTDSENDIFFQNDVNLIKFKEVDGIWYYMHLGLFLVKIPVEYVNNNFSVTDDKTWRRFEYEIIKYMLNDYYNSEDNFRKYIKDNDYNIEDLRKNTESEDDFFESFYDKYYDIVEFFDNWAVIKTDVSDKKVERIIIRPKQEKHIETNCWE